MNGHLSSEEIAGWTIGQRSAAGERHVAECAACRAQVDELAETFSLFRESGERWSEHWRGEGRMPASVRPESRWRRLVIAGAMAASLLAGVLILRPAAPTVRREAPFTQIPYTAPLAPYERTSVMRMNVPVAALVAAGFEVHGPEPGATIIADVLVGQDGRARAFRLISNRSVLQ